MSSARSSFAWPAYGSDTRWRWPSIDKGASNADTRRRPPPADFHWRKRQIRRPAALRGYCPGGPQDAFGGGNRVAWSDGLRAVEPPAYGEDPAPVGRSADRYRNRRQRGTDKRIPADAREDYGQRPRDTGEGPGA